jgi:hypothetical protein
MIASTTGVDEGIIRILDVFLAPRCYTNDVGPLPSIQHDNIVRHQERKVPAPALDCMQKWVRRYFAVELVAQQQVLLNVNG